MPQIRELGPMGGLRAVSVLCENLYLLRLCIADELDQKSLHKLP